MKSASQVVLGNYTDDVTFAGTAGQVCLGLFGLDLPADIRDLSYDLTHLKTTPWHQTALDALALLPVVGGLKYVDEAAGLLKHGDEALAAAKAATQATKAATDLPNAAKQAHNLMDTTKAQRKAEIMEAIAEQIRKTDADTASQQVLDPTWYKQYNEVKSRFDDAAKAASDANGGEYVTYYRVQTPGSHGSKELILVNSDGTISIDTKNYSKQNLSVSAYTTDHAEVFSATGNRAESSYVVAFDVPVWFDELIRENSILQKGSRTNPLNKGGTAPKITDLKTEGCKFELPPFWNEWLEKYAINARTTDIGALP